MSGKFLLGITGASGMIYAKRFLFHAKRMNLEVEAIVTKTGVQVLEFEGCGDILQDCAKIHDIDNFFASPASGSNWGEYGKHVGFAPANSEDEKSENSGKNIFNFANEKNVSSGKIAQKFETEKSGYIGMAVLPCSMGTLGKIAAGTSDNLLIRAADVCLKENRPLALVPREMPLNEIHLENMLRLKRAGATILPACPHFYNHPQNLDELTDTVIERVFSSLRV